LKSRTTGIMIALLAGLLAGVLIGYIVGGGTGTGDARPEEVKGSIYDGRSYDDMKLADNFLFDGLDGQAAFTVKYSPRVTEARIKVNSQSPLKILADFDQGNFGVMGLQTLTVSDNSQIVNGGNIIQITNVGDNQYAFQLYNRNSLPNNITFRVLVNDMQVYQYVVTINKE